MVLPRGWWRGDFLADYLSVCAEIAEKKMSWWLFASDCGCDKSWFPATLLLKAWYAKERLTDAYKANEKLCRFVQMCCTLSLLMRPETSCCKPFSWPNSVEAVIKVSKVFFIFDTFWISGVSYASAAPNQVRFLMNIKRSSLLVNANSFALT